MADLAVFEVGEFDGDGEVFSGVAHGEFDDLGAGYASHVFAAGVGHAFDLSEVAGFHVFHWFTGVGV